VSDRHAERTARLVRLLQEKVRLGPWHRRIFYTAFGALWGSGALWLLIEGFKDPELRGVRTLLQTASMKFHGAAMLVYLALLGTLMTHVRRGNALKANRVSGFANIGLNGVLALSGWLLYYVSGDAARDWASAVHWAIGVLALPLLCAHILAGRGWTARLPDREAPAGAPRVPPPRDRAARRDRA